MIKKLLGIAPTPTENGAYRPSSLALKLATEEKTNFDHTEYDQPYTGDILRVLMLCTEERYMVMQNGKKFSTGNHPVEMFVPMLHFKNAGFEIDVITPTGKPVQIEKWAMPEKDEAVQAIYSEYQAQFRHPASLQEFVAGPMKERSSYIAVFIPGGHGAMLGLPESPAVGKLLHWIHEEGLYLLSICHGPAALLAATNADDGTFLYSGYKIAAFPDRVDKFTPLIGYLPGRLPWYFGEKLENLGVTIVNSSADDTCHVDRKLITGASPKAANDFGKLAVKHLLEAVPANGA